MSAMFVQQEACMILLDQKLISRLLLHFTYSDMYFPLYLLFSLVSTFLSDKN